MHGNNFQSDTNFKRVFSCTFKQPIIESHGVREIFFILESRQQRVFFASFSNEEVIERVALARVFQVNKASTGK